MTDVIITLEGWGNDTWGAQGWGETYFEEGQLTTSYGIARAYLPVTINATGFQINSAIGNVDVHGTAVVNLTGVFGDVQSGIVKAFTGIFIEIKTSFLVNLQMGNAYASIPKDVDVTGELLTTEFNGVDVTTQQHISVTGQQLDLSSGTVTFILNHHVPVEGSAATIYSGVAGISTDQHLSVFGNLLTLYPGNAYVYGWDPTPTPPDQVWTPLDPAYPDPWTPTLTPPAQVWTAVNPAYSDIWTPVPRPETIWTPVDRPGENDNA